MIQPATRTIAGRLELSPGIRWATCCASAAIGLDCISAWSATVPRRGPSVGVSDAQQLSLTRACDHGLAGARDHVHFTADAELAGEVDTGLDGEARVGQQQALVMRLEVIEVGSVAVNLGRDVVAGAMREKFLEPGAAGDVAGGVVGLPAGDRPVGGVGLLDGGDGGVAGGADGGEDVALAFGGLAADDAGPGDVVPDGIRAVGELGEDVDQDEVAVEDGSGAELGGFVVGVGGVGAGGTVGAVVGEEALALHGMPEERHDLELAGVIAAARAVVDVVPAGGEDAVESLLRSVVRGDLVFGEDGLEEADKIGGADDILAEGADELYRSGVDHRDVHDGVARRVLHRDPGGAFEHLSEILFEFLPGGVLAGGAGERVEFAGLDAVDELAGLAVGGDEVVPAAGDEGVGEAEDAVGDRVAVMVIVEEPAVEFLIADRRLEGVEVHPDQYAPVPQRTSSRGTPPPPRCFCAKSSKEKT